MTTSGKKNKKGNKGKKSAKKKPSDTDSAKVLEELRQRVEQLENEKSEWQNEKQLLQQEKEALAADQETLEKGQELLSAERNNVKQDRRSLKKEREDFEAQKAELAEREGKVAEREMKAEAGFASRRLEMLSKLEDVHQDALDEVEALLEKNAEREAAHFERLAAQQREFEQELVKRRKAEKKKLELELASEREQAESEIQRRWKEFEEEKGDWQSECQEWEKQLDQREDKLKKLELEAKRIKREAEFDKEDAEDLKNHLNEIIDERVEEKHAELLQSLQDKEDELERRRSKITELETLLEKRERALSLFDGRSPESVREEVDDLKHSLRQLEEELMNRPTLEDAEELRQLREERDAWRREEQNLLREKERVKAKLDKLRIAVDEIEVLRDRNRALESHKDLLEAAIDELREDVEERLDKRRGQAVFPQMLKMDADPRLNEEPPRLYPSGRNKLDLEKFAEDLRHRIAKSPSGDNGRPELFYRPEDIRAFLGGMAMSRLHLFQGISGIGKSSLPRAFAEEVGGFCDTISVQAGWRDRNDLFGYFNSFENRYYEAGFVQALYKAQLPHYQDRIAIVLLDEMNLSHPEQYAADILDVLERKTQDSRRFELMTFEPGGDSPEFIQEGRFLPMPENVWFVGTANHDETTKDFADKTYDRSFVLELPSSPSPFKANKKQQRSPISYHALSDAFDSACAEHASAAKRADTWTNANLKEIMHETFRVGLGGRLTSQMSRFIPVVMASGGTLGEALDQILATRVFRKIQGRYDNQVEDLESLKKTLTDSWIEGSVGPRASLELIEREIKSLKG